MPTYGAYTKLSNDHPSRSGLGQLSIEMTNETSKKSPQRKKREASGAKHSFQGDPIIQPAVKILSSLVTSPTDDFRRP